MTSQPARRSCWVTRHEAAGYEDQAEAMLAYLEETGHDYDRLDALCAEAGYDTSEAQYEREGGGYWRWEIWGDVCLLDAGHPGPHEFTPTKDILLTFPPLREATR